MIPIRDTLFGFLFSATLAFSVSSCASAEKQIKTQSECSDCGTSAEPTLKSQKNTAEEMLSATCGKPKTGLASFYGKNDGLIGKKTASGQPLNAHQLTAAHPTLPFGTIVKVRSTTTNRYAMVRINDRGPYTKGRMIDLNYAAAKAIGLDQLGTDQVEMQVCTNQ